MVAEPKVRVAWSPRGNPAQMRLLKCQVFEIFFGGARGGGKTDGVLGEFGAHASRYGREGRCFDEGALPEVEQLTRVIGG